MRRLIVLAIVLAAIPASAIDKDTWANTYPIVGKERSEFIQIVEMAESCLAEGEYLRHVIVLKGSVLVGKSSLNDDSWEVSPCVLLRRDGEKWYYSGEEDPINPGYKTGVSVEVILGILEQLPDEEQYLSFKVKNDKEMIINTGRVDGPVGGGGKYFRFKNEGGVWKLSRTGTWIS